MSKQRRFDDISQVLFAISNTVNTASDLNELCPSIHHALNRIIDASNFSIALYDPSNGSIVITYCVDLKGTCYPPIVRIDETDSLSAAVIRTDRPLMMVKSEILKMSRQSANWIPQGATAADWLGAPLKLIRPSSVSWRCNPMTIPSL